MALQNFVFKAAPAVSAAWLNLVDLLKVNYDQSAAETTATVTPTNTGYHPDPWIDVRRYGATLNGVADDTAAFVKANSVAAVNGGVVRFTGTPLFNSADITIPKNVTWEGPQGNPGIDNPVASGTYLQNGTILLNPLYTIKLANKAGIRNCTILNSNYGPSGTFPLPFTDATNATNGVAAFAGTALTVAGSDAIVDTVLILAFAQAYYSSGYDRTYINKVRGDNTAGIFITQSFDIGHIYGVHFWPFLTAGHSWTTQLISTRTGAGFKLTGHYDGGNISHSFAYGYAINFDIEANNSIHLDNCLADGGSTSTGQIGYKFAGAAELISMDHCSASGVDQGMYFNIATPTTSDGNIILTGCKFWGNHTHLLSDQHSNLNILGCYFRDTNAAPATAITLTSATCTGYTNIIGNIFCAPTTAFNIGTTGQASYEHCRIYGNSIRSPTTDVSIGARQFYENTTGIRTYTVYNTSPTFGGPVLFSRAATGTVDAPGIINSGINVGSFVGQTYDTAAFQSVASMRFTTRGVPAAGSTPGGIVFATTPTGAAAVVDRWTINEQGTLFPSPDNTIALGAVANRMTRVWSVAFQATQFVCDATGLGFYGITSQAQPTTAGAAATFVANAGTAVNDASTFDGYTLKQVIKALRTLGLLA